MQCLLKKMFILLVGVIIVPSMCSFAFSQKKDQSRQTEKTTSDGKSDVRKLIEKSLNWYELYPSDESSIPMKSRVVMRWANNIRGSADGLTMIWTRKGRPETVACIYPWRGNLYHEFDSLSRGTLVARREGDQVWQPKEPGLKFLDIPDASSPADSKVKRLRQMKKLASQFSSTMLGWRADNSDREDLRLLPRPLYRYDSKASDVLDGAVFAFTQGTDPESLLLIEAFQEAKKYKWQFAFVRRTSGALEGRFKGEIVWTAPKFPVSSNREKSHIVFHQKIMP